MGVKDRPRSMGAGY